MRRVQAKTLLSARMALGETPFGIFVSSIDPACTSLLADAGFDFVVLDNEHGRLGRLEVENHVRAAEAKGIIPFVRVLENNPALIQSMLNVGAHGVMVHHIDDADGARAAVEASRYAPAGRRGMCPACHAGGYQMTDWAEHVRSSNENVMVIPIIESRQAVANIDAIFAVDGIDLVIFGPGDLSADLGIDLLRESHLLNQAWGRVKVAAQTAHKRVMRSPGFGFESADMLIAEMELMVLHRAASKMVRDQAAANR